jgi:hypothetical protein
LQIFVLCTDSFHNNLVSVERDAKVEGQ